MLRYKSTLVAFNLLFFFSIYGFMGWSATCFSTYEDVAIYIDKPVVLIGGTNIDFTPIHRDMGRNETAIHASLFAKSSDKDKNIFILRFTPVFEDSSSIMTPEDSIFIKYGDDLETIFISGASHLTDDEQSDATHWDTSPELASHAFRVGSAKGKPNPPPGFSDKLCKGYIQCEGYAGSVEKLATTLTRRFVTSTSSAPDHILEKWNAELNLATRLEAIRAHRASFIFTGDLDLPKVAAYIAKTKPLVKPDGPRGSFCCSEQIGFNYVMEDVVFERLMKEINHRLSLKGSSKLKALIANGHTTKHPCRMCGLTFYTEAIVDKDSFVRRIKENLLSSISDQLAKDFKTIMLVSYKDDYKIPTVVSLPDIASITHKSSAGDFEGLGPKFGLVSLGSPKNKIETTYQYEDEVISITRRRGSVAAGAAAEFDV